MRRASLDFACEPESLSSYPTVDYRTRLVRGCGQRAIYIWTCDSVSRASSCTWLLNFGPTPMTP